jgi:hypothetical protein
MYHNLVSIVVMCLFVSFNNNTTSVTGGALSKLHADIRVDIFDMKVNNNCLFSLLVLLQISGEVKLVLLAKTSPLSEMMLSCKLV